MRRYISRCGCNVNSYDCCFADSAWRICGDVCVGCCYGTKKKSKSGALASVKFYSDTVSDMYCPFCDWERKRGLSV